MAQFFGGLAISAITAGVSYLARDQLSTTPEEIEQAIARGDSVIPELDPLTGPEKLGISFVGLAIGFVGSTILRQVTQPNKDSPARPTINPRHTIRDRSLQQPIPNEFIVVGETIVPGDIVIFSGASFEGSDPKYPVDEDNVAQIPPASQNPGSYAVVMYLVASHEIEEFIDSRLGEVSIQPSPEAPFFSQQPQFIKPRISQPSPTRRPEEVEDSEVPFLAESRRLGTDTQGIDPIIMRNFPNIDPNFFQLGHATATVELYAGKNTEENIAVWSNRENEGVDSNAYSARVKGLKVYDPRDPEQDPFDKSTHRYSDNAALVIMNLLTNPLFISDPVKWENIDIEGLIYAANICDIGVSAYDRYDAQNNRILYQQKNYTVSGVISSSQSPIDVLTNMLLSCDGYLTYINGRYNIVPGHRREPVGTISDANLFGAIGFASGVPDDQRVGALTANIRARVERSGYDYAYEEVSLPIVSDVPEAEIVNRINTLTFPYAEGIARGYRLCTFKFRKARLDRILNIKVDRTGFLYEPGDVVRFDSVKFPYANGLYEVLEIMEATQRFGESFGLTLTEYSHNTWDYDAERLEPTFDYIEYRKV